MTTFWADGNDVVTLGTWVFATGPADTNVTFSIGNNSNLGYYVNWAPGYPSGSPSTNCVVADSTAGGKWTDAACGATYGYVIEYECAVGYFALSGCAPCETGHLFPMILFTDA